MNRLFTVFILCLCAYSTFSATTNSRDTAASDVAVVDQPKEESGTLNRFFKFLSGNQKSEDSNSTVSSKSKRQLPPPGRLGPQIPDGGLGQEFPDFYDFYPNDFLYDYYDWVCSDTSCQLCNILTSECCDPQVNVNCFLPDSCLNNPCLSGGTCIPTRTIDERPDFICACYPGFTGKYCQLTNEFFFPPPPPPPPPAAYGGPQYGQQGGYGGQQGGYGGQQGGYGGQQGGYGGQQMGGYGQQQQYGAPQYAPPQQQYQPQYQPPQQQQYQPPQQPQYQPQQQQYQAPPPPQASYGNNNNNLPPVPPQQGLGRIGVPPPPPGRGVPPPPPQGLARGPAPGGLPNRPQGMPLPARA